MTQAKGAACSSFFEPLDAGQVEVIGGLVEQQRCRASAPEPRRWRDACASRRRASRPGHRNPRSRRGPGFRPRETRLRSGTRGAGKRAAHDGADGWRRLEVRILRDVGEARALAHGDLAGIGRCAAGEDFQQRGLAGAVGADQAEPVAFIDAERDARNNGSAPKDRVRF